MASLTAATKDKGHPTGWPFFQVLGQIAGRCTFTDGALDTLAIAKHTKTIALPSPCIKYPDYP